MIVWGETVGLRRFEDRISEAELERLYRWSSDDEILRWSGGAPLTISLEEFREHLESEQRYGPRNRRAFFILRRDTLELIGRAGLFGIDWDKRDGELGIVIGEKGYWGKGYGRDAVATLLRHIFKTSSLKRVYLFTFADNKRAQRAFRAAGFRAMGNVRRTLPEVGEFDGVQMEVSRAEFLGQEARALQRES